MKPFAAYLRSSNRSGRNRHLLGGLAALALAAFVGCGEEPTTPPPAEETLTLTPRRIVLFAGDTTTFGVRAESSPIDVTWHVVEGPGSVGTGGLFAAARTIAGDSAVAIVEARTSGTPARYGRARILILADTTRRSCFERDVRPIIRSSCALAECHDPGSRQGGLDFTSDVVVQRSVTPGEPEASLIHAMITNTDDHERMPPSPRSRLSADQVGTIARWIEQGASLRRCPAPGEQPCDTASVGYSAVVRPILLSSCTTCHEGTGAGGEVDLSTYEGVKTVAETGQLLGSLRHAPGYAPMPAPGVRLPDCEILQIQAWIDAGARND